MRQSARPIPGQKYQHFKGGLYQILTIGLHSETNEEMVVYQALYGDFKVYIRPLAMFLNTLDKEKYPNASQELRFQPVTSQDSSVVPGEPRQETDLESVSQSMKPQAEVNPYLLQFLEAETFGAKLKIFLEMKESINEVLLTEIAASLDISTGTGTLEEQYSSVQYALHTLAKYERNKR